MYSNLLFTEEKGTYSGATLMLIFHFFSYLFSVIILSNVVCLQATDFHEFIISFREYKNQKIKFFKKKNESAQRKKGKFACISFAYIFLSQM